MTEKHENTEKNQNYRKILFRIKLKRQKEKEARRRKKKE